MDELNEFTDLVNKINVSDMDLIDQLSVCMAYAKFVEAVKPIYSKYAAQNQIPTNVKYNSSVFVMNYRHEK